MANELDLPLLPSADQIRRREFATVRRGYDPDQVRDYLAAVAQQVENLENEARELKLRADTAPRPDTSAVPAAPAAPTAATEADPYETIAKRFAGVLGTADKEASRIVEDAATEASTILQEARAEADRVRLDAQSTAEKARSEGEMARMSAAQEADRILASLTDRRRALMDDLKGLRGRLLSMADQIDVDRIGEDSQVPKATAKPSPTPSKPAETAPTSSSDPSDPRYEDLWVSKDETVELPDLALTDLDFDEDRPGD
jgi:DivIVA domain-containing protein